MNAAPRLEDIMNAVGPAVERMVAADPVGIRGAMGRRAYGFRRMSRRRSSCASICDWGCERQRASHPPAHQRLSECPITSHCVPYSIAIHSVP